jgi:hypothetical protein
MGKRIEFKVSLVMPDGLLVDEMKEYIADAVHCWGKGGDPEGPLFNLDQDGKRPIRVTRLAKRK